MLIANPGMWLRISDFKSTVYTNVFFFFLLPCLTKQGTVKLVFQPAEEGHAGGYHVLQEGVLDDAEAIFAMHVDTHLPVGTVGSRPGPFLAGSARFKATITGKGGHAAVPHDAVDPVVVASSTVLSLQQLVAREIDPLQSAVDLSFAIHQVVALTFLSSHLITS
jgi:amidohydrolase